MDKIDFKCLLSEVVLTYSRSSGKGGQNVNKVSTKAELAFNIDSSACLDEEQKKIISEKLYRRINDEGFIKLQSSEARSQLGNKELVLKKFKTLIEKSLKKPVKRIATSKPLQATESRLTQKRRTSEIKKLRQKKSD
ncbi:MAG: aminoacyl-tRNA hydrolase [Bacteroidetes bacterium]|nr:aminoacyl-tRNA hydrolase [Bacteroidota bacterium]MBX7237931.1 aminoacyl-tRNA hydrolase [Bacteroidia bacterium]MCC7515024.1 aminoacyl-tRNA hydrolase [Bacteroidia bacterium]MCW5919000.1 aminoacyl-tRNA hydrolase [Bacteroidota bacterium]HMU76464.1 alternative ribosome rescue aminoacyl-tRNA hydrolase ArfB [Bacteroidia bacterium]